MYFHVFIQFLALIDSKTLEVLLKKFDLKNINRISQHVVRPYKSGGLLKIDQYIIDYHDIDYIVIFQSNLPFGDVLDKNKIEKLENIKDVLSIINFFPDLQDITNVVFALTETHYQYFNYSTLGNSGGFKVNYKL